MKYTDELKELEHDLQELAIAFDKLYAGHLISVADSYAHLDNKGFELLAVPDSIQDIPDSGGHKSGKTINGLKLVTCY